MFPPDLVGIRLRQGYYISKISIIQDYSSTTAGTAKLAGHRIAMNEGDIRIGIDTA